MNKIYLWLGFTTKSEEEYWDYFSDNDGTPQFCIDTNLDWLDQDFMGYYYNADSDNLQNTVENTPESGLYEVMLEAASKKKISKANAMFYYTGDDIVSVDENKTYNDLIFVGVFDWE